MEIQLLKEIKIIQFNKLILVLFILILSCSENELKLENPRKSYLNFNEFIYHRNPINYIEMRIDSNIYLEVLTDTFRVEYKNPKIHLRYKIVLCIKNFSYVYSKIQNKNWFQNSECEIQFIDQFNNYPNGTRLFIKEDYVVKDNIINTIRVKKCSYITWFNSKDDKKKEPYYDYFDMSLGSSTDSIWTNLRKDIFLKLFPKYLDKYRYKALDSVIIDFSIPVNKFEFYDSIRFYFAE